MVYLASLATYKLIICTNIILYYYTGIQPVFSESILNRSLSFSTCVFSGDTFPAFQPSNSGKALLNRWKQYFSAYFHDLLSSEVRTILISFLSSTSCNFHECDKNADNICIRFNLCGVEWADSYNRLNWSHFSYYCVPSVLSLSLKCPLISSYIYIILIFMINISSCNTQNLTSPLVKLLLWH